MVTKGILYLKITFCTLFFSSVLAAQENPITVDVDFPGGNIIVERIENDTVWLEPDLRDTKGHWFYFYYRIKGVRGKTIKFIFPEGKRIFSAMGPAYSINNEDSWRWLGQNSIHQNSFSFTFTEKDTVGFFCTAFPYTQAEFTEFIDRVRNRDQLKLNTLCLSEKNREVEEIIISPVEEVRHRVLLVARNHACEMMANYELEGIINSVLNHRDLDYLRHYVEFLIVPFMDKDGVEDGDQGKNRIPHDHNRDYGENPIYSSVKSLKKKTAEWSGGKLKVMLDLHCPYITGKSDEYIYIVGDEKKEIAEQQRVFSDLLEGNSTGELKYYSENLMEYGVSWNKANNYRDGIPFSSWAENFPGALMTGTIEFPYALVSGVGVSKDNARKFGEAIAFSIQDYLQTLDVRGTH